MITGSNRITPLARRKVLHTISTRSPSVGAGEDRTLGHRGESAADALKSLIDNEGDVMKRRTPVLAAVLLTAGVLASSEAIAGSAVTADLARPAQTLSRPSTREHDGHQRGFERFLRRYETANSAFLNGDPEPWLAIVTKNELASIFGGFGGLGESGVAEVGQRYLLAARAFLPSGAEADFEYLVKDVRGKLAYTVAIERADVLYAGHTEVEPQVLRVTMMFRFERGGWKIIHRHADMMVDLQLPTP
jgi:SnoaL-like domain